MTEEEKNKKTTESNVEQIVFYLFSLGNLGGLLIGKLALVERFD